MQTKEVLITWRDTPAREFPTLVVITDDKITDYSEVNDDGIFYYFTTEQEYKDALINGAEEFTMREAD